VLRRAQQAIWDLDGSGIGILEHSHRGKEFGRVLDRAESSVRDVGGIGDDFAVLFMTAGATHHFALVPQNFLPGGTADYCHTGVWSGKAIEDAKRYGGVHVACSSEADNFASVPATCTYSASPRYVHYTSNETIYGTQWAAPPQGAPAPLVCDASSDIFSKPLALDGHGLVYAGAQKNLGPSGISLVIARKDFIATGAKDLPALYQYRTYQAERSMHNTPNTFGIWMIAEVCAWIKEQGGLAVLAEQNRRKALLLYDALDASNVWRPHAKPGSRSLMNVTWRGDTKQREEDLIARAEERGLSGLRGHRSVGGMRASLYNAFPEDGVRRLVDLLHELER
jgi:phosphoserine aminotransferase